MADNHHTAVDYVAFAKDYMAIYHNGGNLHDLARKLSLTETACRSRKDQLRRNGVELPLFKRGISKIMLESVSQIIASSDAIPTKNTLKVPPKFI